MNLTNKITPMPEKNLFAILNFLHQIQQLFLKHLSGNPAVAYKVFCSEFGQLFKLHFKNVLCFKVFFIHLNINRGSYSTKISSPSIPFPRGAIHQRNYEFCKKRWYLLISQSQKYKKILLSIVDSAGDKDWAYFQRTKPTCYE